MAEYVLIFDIPKREAVLRIRTYRALKLIRAKLVQRSIWKSKHLDDLKGIAKFVREHGGNAYVIEWKKVY